MTKYELLKHLKTRRLGVLSSFTIEEATKGGITSESITYALEMIDEQRKRLSRK